MSAMTYAGRRFTGRTHSLVTRATMIVLFWVVAAVFVVVAHSRIEFVSPVASVVVKTCTLVLTSLAYMKLAAREGTVHHALFVGLAWLLLAIAAEVTMTAITGHSWFDLIGTPGRPYLRDVLLFAWIASPALFARRTA